MFLCNPFIEPAKDWVTVWVGDLNADELEKYLDEPGGTGDDEPISTFCRDFGRWYDHDFVWAEGVDEPLSVRTLCEINGIKPREFVDGIVERCTSNDASALLVLWNAKRIDNQERTFAGGRLQCIGSWEQEAPLTD